jgi:hypothetical protein
MTVRQASCEGYTSQAFAAVWAVLIAAVFFTNLDGYVYLSTDAWFARPVYWTLAALLVTLPFLSGRLEGLWLRLRSPIGYWSVAFLVLPLAYVILFPKSDIAVKVLFQHVHFVVLLWLFVATFMVSRRAATLAVVVCTLGVALFSWMEMFYPLLSDTPDYCRAAGLYLNPNGAAYALLFGMLGGLAGCSDRVKPWFLVVAGASILPTFSRSALLIFGVATVVLLAVDIVDWRRLKLPVLAGSIGATVLFALALSSVNDRHECVVTAIADRAQIISNLLHLQPAPEAKRSSPSSGARASSSQRQDLLDFSAAQRSALTRRALLEYGENWVLGRGLGATWTWEGKQRPHNVYLEKGIEMGLIGLLLWPAFLVALVLSLPKRKRKSSLAFLISCVALGIFSHNLFESRQILIVAALLLAVSLDKDSERIVPAESSRRNSI